MARPSNKARVLKAIRTFGQQVHGTDKRLGDLWYLGDDGTEHVRVLPLAELRDVLGSGIDTAIVDLLTNHQAWLALFDEAEHMATVYIFTTDKPAHGEPEYVRPDDPDDPEAGAVYEYGPDFKYGRRRVR